MDDKHLLDRIEKLDLTNAIVGDKILYCPACDFQGEPNSASKTKCDCGNNKRIITVDRELLQLNLEAKIKELQTYLEIEGTELGEVGRLLCRIEEYPDYVGEDFRKALIKEISDQLDNFKENSEIVEEKAECFHCKGGKLTVKDLVWL